VRRPSRCPPVPVPEELHRRWHQQQAYEGRIEGNRERIQVFEGIVMRLRGGGITRSITVRRIASGVGVERTFKINSPRIEKIEVVRHGQVRRAQLYFLRKRVGKAATIREKRR